MILSLRPLNDVANVNSWEVASEVSWTEGDATTVYFQTIDSSLDTAMRGFEPPGRRYMAPLTSTCVIQIQNIDSGKVINRTATQPFAEDASIWMIQILSTDLIHGAPQLLVTLTEPTRTIRGLVKNAVRIYSTSNNC